MRLCDAKPACGCVFATPRTVNRLSWVPPLHLRRCHKICSIRTTASDNGNSLSWREFLSVLEFAKALGDCCDRKYRNYCLHGTLPYIWLRIAHPEFSNKSSCNWVSRAEGELSTRANFVSTSCPLVCKSRVYLLDLWIKAQYSAF